MTEMPECSSAKLSALLRTCMARRKSLAGIKGKMADLSDCVWSYNRWCTRESYIYGVSDSANVTAWSCLNINRLPSAMSTVGWIRARASALRYLRTCSAERWRGRAHLRTHASPYPSPSSYLSAVLAMPPYPADSWRPPPPSPWHSWKLGLYPKLFSLSTSMDMICCSKYKSWFHIVCVRVAE